MVLVPKPNPSDMIYSSYNNLEKESDRATNFLFLPQGRGRDSTLPLVQFLITLHPTYFHPPPREIQAEIELSH